MKTRIEVTSCERRFPSGLWSVIALIGGFFRTYRTDVRTKREAIRDAKAYFASNP
jgi:hypothetical protein